MAGAGTYPTARLLIQDALIELGVLAPGEDLKAEDAQFALRTLNRMMEAWNAEELMIFSLERYQFPLISGKQSYTLGTGGDINIDRPVEIEMMSVILTYAQPYPIELPVEMLLDEQWRGITLKNTPSSFPYKCWIEGNFPLNVLWFWPVPMDANQILLYYWNKTAASTLDTQLKFPNGYEEAIVTNLAVMLSGSYGVSPSGVLTGRATQGKMRLKEFNSQPVLTTVDPSLMGKISNSIAVKTRGRVVDRI